MLSHSFLLSTSFLSLLFSIFSLFFFFLSLSFLFLFLFLSLSLFFSPFSLSFSLSFSLFLSLSLSFLFSVPKLAEFVTQAVENENIFCFAKNNSVHEKSKSGKSFLKKEIITYSVKLSSWFKQNVLKIVFLFRDQRDFFTFKFILIF